MNAHVQQVGFDKRVDQFVRLRDKIKEIEERQAAELSPYKEALDKLSALMLQHLNNVGADKVGTEFGTVYRSEKKSATLADKSAFWTYVTTQGLWDLLDYKANAPAVAEFIEKNNIPPPGVNYNVRFTVGVRRS